MGILKKFLKKDASNNKTFGGVRVSAIFDILILVILAVIIYRFVGDGDRFLGMYPHPLTFFLMLIVIQYGANEGFVCILAMTTLLYAGNMPEQPINQSNYDYLVELSYHPVVWIALNLIFGGLSKRKISLINELSESISQVEEQSDVIAKSYSKLQQRNQKLELKIAEEVGMVVQIFDIAQSLYELNKENYFLVVNKAVRTILQPESFSIYMLENNSLKLRSHYGWEQPEEIKQEFNESSQLFEIMVKSKKIANVANPKHRDAFLGQGVVAVPIIDDGSEKVLGMLKVDQMEFGELTLKWLKLASLLSRWIGSSIHQMKELDFATENSIASPETQILSSSFFEQQRNFLMSLATRLKFPLTKLVVTVTNTKEFTAQEQQDIAIALNHSISIHLRKVDQMFEYGESDTLRFIILLPGTPEKDSHIVVEKINKDFGEKSCNLGKAKCSFIVQPLVKEVDVNE